MAATKKVMKKMKKTLAKLQVYETLADELAPVCHFNHEEIKSILHAYDALASQSKMDRLHFREVLHSCFEMIDDLMLDLTFRAFDRNSDGIVDAKEFLCALSSMMRGDEDEMVEFCYYVYDMNGDGSLAREELYQCLKGSFLAGYGLEPDEIEDAERDIVELALKKLDVNRDGQITFEDFKAAVKTDPLLIQACGPCLISPKCMARFLFTITEDYRAYTSEMLNNAVTGKKHGSKRGSSSSSSTSGSRGASTAGLSP